MITTDKQKLIARSKKKNVNRAVRQITQAVNARSHCPGFRHGPLISGE